MSAWDLPTSASIGGADYEVRCDFRTALDALSVMGDPETDDEDRAEAVLVALFPEYGAMPPEHHAEAARFAQWFLAGGDSPAKAPKGKLVDWEQDAPLYIPAVNRVLGREVRECADLHWWTFLAAYCEIGDCLFAQVVAIRNKKRKNRKLDKHEERFYRENRALVDFASRETDAEKALFDEWMGE